MLVQGLLKVDVEISPLDAIKVLEDNLGITEHCKDYSKLCILQKDHKNNLSGKKALYEVVDMSWYGTYSDEYKFITNDENKIRCFETLCEIKNLIKENKKLF